MEAAQPPSGQPVYVQPPPRGTHPLAILSFIASLLWVFWIGSIVGVVTGHVARRDIRREQGARSGDGFAIAGLVLGYIGIATLVLFLALVAIGSSGSGGSSSLSGNCITNNFGAELCGQDALDYCDNLDENQADMQENADDMAADARRLNRQAKRDAERYGGSARDYGYDPSAVDDAYQGVDDGFSRKSQEVCQQVRDAEGQQ